MKRKVYLICQKTNWNKGKPQVISDGGCKLEYVFASDYGLKRAIKIRDTLNMIKDKNPVHIRKATIIIEEELSEKKGFQKDGGK